MNIVIFSNAPIKARCVYFPVVVAFQGGGFCTTDKAKKLLTNEKKRLTKAYFSSAERLKYGIQHKLTFPMLRKKILNNESAVRAYRKFISKIYGN